MLSPSVISADYSVSKAGPLSEKIISQTALWPDIQHYLEITLYSSSYGLHVEDGDTSLSEGINNTNVCTVSIFYRTGLQFFFSFCRTPGA